LGDGLQKRITELDTKDEENELDMYEREEIRSLLAYLNKNIFKQEAIWRQKARQKWLKQGDLNTKYFHLSIKLRRATNELHGVLENGQWCENKDKVKTRSENSLKPDS